MNYFSPTKCQLINQKIWNMGRVISKSQEENNDDIKFFHFREFKKVITLKQKFNPSLFSKHPIITETAFKPNPPPPPLCLYLTLSLPISPSPLLIMPSAWFPILSYQEEGDNNKSWYPGPIALNPIKRGIGGKPPTLVQNNFTPWCLKLNIFF